MKEFVPVNQNVILDINEEKGEQKTASGIIIPDSAKVKQNMAKVVAVAKIDNAEIQAGDTVLYKEFSGTTVEFEGNKYLLIPYSDILAKVVETEEI